ncbi:MAG: DoxX family protein [Paludibacteraceae bacterium]|nr:DoxX family protein [Paludibacteraceae bacterium]
MKKSLHIIGSIARTLVALTFIFSGLVKAIDPLGTVYKIEDYLKAFGGFFIDFMPYAEIMAVGLIGLEFVLGVCMLCNVRTNWTAWIALVFYLFMTPLTLWIALTNPVSDCGCFGDAIVLTNWQTFRKNIVLLALVVTLLCCRKAIPQLWRTWAEITIAAVAAVAVFILMKYTYQHLPLIDFRPYKVGNHIPTLMEIPEDAPQNIYQTTLIYEKNGVQQEFTLQNYPKGDPEWTFVEQRSVLIQKGYQPPIHDFEIMTLGYADITYDILESEEPVTLAIIYDIAQMDRKQLNKVLALYYNTPDKYYIVTGSGTEEIYTFAEELGLCEEEAWDLICTADPVTLKTIVRANPGLVIIQNGTIIEKKNFRQVTIDL